LTTFASQAQLLDVLIELQPRIRRLITRRVGSAAAADLTQELFLRLCRVGTNLPTREDARRYLIRIAINAATDHQRVEGRRSELLTGMPEPGEGRALDPQHQVLMDETIAQVETALAELPSKCRDVLWLSRVEGMTHAEIANTLGVSKSLVEKYIVRAILHCRTRLSDGTRA
jgi:RNA polymerase sigma factor (sigma-70 family)